MVLIGTITNGIKLLFFFFFIVIVIFFRGRWWVLRVGRVSSGDRGNDCSSSSCGRDNSSVLSEFSVASLTTWVKPTFPRSLLRLVLLGLAMVEYFWNFESSPFSKQYGWFVDLVVCTLQYKFYVAKIKRLKKCCYCFYCHSMEDLEKIGYCGDGKLQI